jgi:Fe-S cluster assembly protein SufD
MNVEKQYVDLFTQYEDVVCRHAPDCMNALRTRAFADFERAGFPSLKHEDYRYTDVAQSFAPNYGLNINRLKAPVHPEEVFRCAVPDMRTHLFFVVNDSFYKEVLPDASLPDGVYAGGMKPFTERYPEVASRYYGKIAKTSTDAVTALNTLLAQDGFVLYVPRNTKINRAVQLVNIFRSAVDIMANRRILVIMEPCSEAKLLVCDHSPDDVKCLSTQVVEIFVEEGARFDYYDLEESTVSTTRYMSLYVKQEAQSNVLVNGITLNNGLTRNNYHIDLDGEAAETTLCGMAIQDKDQQVDTYTYITHAVPHCKSAELFKNVLNDRSIGIFNGRIKVKEGAEKTEALQTNRNMCMTREARMYSKPQLEIYADDVKCSHGMTTGQLDENALFYMQSRGLSRDEAKTLLSVAFTADIINNVRLNALKDRLHFLVEKRFRGELVQCAGCRTAKATLRQETGNEG